MPSACNTYQPLFLPRLSSGPSMRCNSPSEIIADGELHRIDGPEDKRGKKSGWYVLHADGIGGGAFGCYKTNIRRKWRGSAPAAMTPGERDLWRKRIKRRRELAEAER